MLPPPWKIEGAFAGVDPTLVYAALGVTVGVIVLAAIVARDLARLQPKRPPPSQVQKASGEFDAWTERPKSQADKEAEYYALYGSTPARGEAGVTARAPPAPPPPASVQSLGAVVVDLSGGAPVQEEGWADVPGERPVTPASASAMRIHPPATPRPAGPTDEVVAPTHGRRIRDTSTGELPPRDPGELAFERSSEAAGAVPPSPPPGDPFSPKAAPPPPPPPPPPSPRKAEEAARIAEALPEGTSLTATAKSAFRGPSRGQSVVGAGSTGMQEGAVLSPERKAIRCPKCQTVFAGPAARPATVKCPACGTSGTLK